MEPYYFCSIYIKYYSLIFTRLVDVVYKINGENFCCLHLLLTSAHTLMNNFSRFYFVHSLNMISNKTSDFKSDIMGYYYYFKMGNKSQHFVQYYPFNDNDL